MLAPLPADAELSFAVELHTRATRAAEPLPAALRESWCETDAGADARGGGAAVASAAMGGGGGGPYVVPLASLDVCGVGRGLSVLAAEQPAALAQVRILQNLIRDLPARAARQNLSKFACPGARPGARTLE